MDNNKNKKKVRFSENVVSSVKEFIVDPNEYNSKNFDSLKMGSLQKIGLNRLSPVKRKLNLESDFLMGQDSLYPSKKGILTHDKIFLDDNDTENNLDQNSLYDIENLKLNNSSNSMFEMDDDNIDVDMDEKSIIKNIIKSRHIKADAEQNKNQKTDDKKNNTDIFFDNDINNDVASGGRDRMDVEEMIGQEPATIKFDGEISITPFNLNDEMEEGYFDRTGNFIFNKKDHSLVTDAWLDMLDDDNENHDKSEIKKNKPIRSTLTDNNTDDSDDGSYEQFDSVAAIETIIDILKPNQTVLSAIKQLGKDKSLTEQFDILTENADNLLNFSSEYNVYSMSRESLMFKLNKLKETTCLTSEEIDNNSGMGTIHNQASYSKINSEKSPKETDPTLITTTINCESNLNDKLTDQQGDKVMWVYKWNELEEQIFGPFDTQTMLSWKEQGFFNGQAVICKKYHYDDTNFYPISRVDFDLYL